MKRVDHSSAGAVWAYDNLPNNWGKIIAHAVAGHHCGLKDNLFAKESGRIDQKRAVLAPVLTLAESDGFILPAGVAPPTGIKAKPVERGFALAMLTRMVFSALIDADRTVAAGLPDAHQPSIADLYMQLMSWIQARQVVASDINTLRAKVLHDALAHAHDPHGVFLLPAPTGIGKTLTALAFALAHALHHGLDRVIVVAPYTSIIEQTAKVYRDALGPWRDAVLEHHCDFEPKDADTERYRLEADRWDSPVIVTTAVQFFESLFASSPTRCRKLHNIARSVVLVDEAQVMPLTLLRPCVAALKELSRNYHASVVLTTATMPALVAPGEKGGRGFVGGFENPVSLVNDVPALFSALRRVTVRYIGQQTTDELAAIMEGAAQGLHIVNRRRDAMAHYASISHMPGARHLTTGMHAIHRMRVLAEIRADLKAGRPCRVVATTLIEAGVDISFRQVLRASTGLDQQAQAAGRCNREGKWCADDCFILVYDAPVLRELSINTQEGMRVLRRYIDDPFSPAAVQSYFERVYWRQDENLDRGGVLRMCEDKAASLDFPFEAIATSMRFIDDVMLPVIVPCEEREPGEVDELLRRLDRPSLRSLGRYTVSIAEQDRARLVASGDCEMINDRFVVLRNTDRYSAETGLNWT